MQMQSDCIVFLNYLRQATAAPYLPKVGSKGSITTEGKILQNRGDFEFEASKRSALAHCCAGQ